MSYPTPLAIQGCIKFLRAYATHRNTHFYMRPKTILNRSKFVYLVFLCFTYSTQFCMMTLAQEKALLNVIQIEPLFRPFRISRLILKSQYMNNCGAVQGIQRQTMPCCSVFIHFLFIILLKKKSIKNFFLHLRDG